MPAHGYPLFIAFSSRGERFYGCPWVVKLHLITFELQNDLEISSIIHYIFYSFMSFEKRGGRVSSVVFGCVLRVVGLKRVVGLGCCTAQEVSRFISVSQLSLTISTAGNRPATLG